MAECLSSHYVSTIVPKNGQPSDWLWQFLALRDVSHFVVGASLQYVVNREERDVRLQTSSARTRNAVLHSLNNIQIPAHITKAGLVASFSHTFRIVLPDTPDLEHGDSSGPPIDENESDALLALCAKLNDRQVLHRVSDREVVRNVSEITRNIALLDDSPTGQFRSAGPRLFAVNCGKVHLAGESQLRFLENLRLPVRPEPCKIHRSGATR